jgi:phosphoadenosine phosphosulfate reductase
MFEKDMRPELQKKIDFAIRLLKAVGEIYDGTIEIAYSGGKDSDVILQLAKEAGIKYQAIYKNTTIDPPGTIKHAQEMGAKIIQPKQTFFELVAQRGYPNRLRRFCCEVIKEYKIHDKLVMGVRKAESRKRAERYKEPTECRLYNKKTEHVEAIYPILEWTDQDVAEFIADRGIKCAPVYYDEQGKFHVERRLGCMGCPLAYKKKRIAEFQAHPGLVKAYIKAGRKYMETHPDSELKRKYGDEYAYFYRNLYCTSEQEFNHVATGLFGTPDFKGFLEKQFNIKF